METIRDYLQELSATFKGVDYNTTKILNACEAAAKQGAMGYKTTLPNMYAEKTIDYLVTIGRLTVEVNLIGHALTLITISWSDENEHNTKV